MEKPYRYIMFCQATYKDDFNDTLKCLERVSPHVDYCIIVEDGSLTEEQKSVLHKFRDIRIRTFNFVDNLPEMRNQYIEDAKKMDPWGWCLVSDPDELMSETLCLDLRKIVESAEKDGYNVLGIHARDVWTDLDKLDAGEREKEQPYRDSGFWKYLLFKLSPNFRYVGVGQSKNVHESWGAPDVPPKTAHLEKKYYYEHRKSVQKIWRNAARNLFIGGSGDNLGPLNPTWVELRKITDSLGLSSWKQFEDYLKKGGIATELKDFIVKHRSDSEHPWEAEVRELFKWYFWMHPAENTGNWQDEYKPPVWGSPVEVENYVTKCYFDVLGRSPDEAGKNQYVNDILSGKLKREDLPLILQSSSEFKEKCNVKDIEEYVTKCYLTILGRTPDDGGKKHYVESIMMGKISKEELPQIFINSAEYCQRLQQANKDTIALCIMGYGVALPMIIESVETVKPYVDEIHVQGDDFTQDQIETLQKLGCQVHIEPWRDEFSDYKNKCIGHANTKWVLICDHDEIPTKELAENLHRIIVMSEHGTRFNLVEFESINQTVDKDGKVISENRGSGKALLHVNVKDAYYGNPHIWLKPGHYAWIGTKVGYAYRHVKEEGVDLQRAIRNVFLGGGGDNFKEKNPLWPELRALTDKLGIVTYRQFLAYLGKGNIDAELKEWFEKAYVAPWHDQEMKAFKQYYYHVHPEEGVRVPK